MHYSVTVFGVKDTSEEIITFIQESLRPVDLIVTVSDAVKGRNEISGETDLDTVAKKYHIPVFKAESYSLDDAASLDFFKDHSFDLGISMGWQRLIPPHVLDAFRQGIFGFHGNAGYLPFGRGRSPLNWSVLLGDTRFNLNLFRYDEKADSPNVFATEMFQLNLHDDIRTAQYKNMIAAKRLIAKLIAAFETGTHVEVRTSSKDFDSWYEKRTAADGKIDWHARTRDIYNLVRAVTSPFPGAWCYIESAATSPGSYGATPQVAADALRASKRSRRESPGLSTPSRGGHKAESLLLEEEVATPKALTEEVSQAAEEVSQAAEEVSQAAEDVSQAADEGSDSPGEVSLVKVWHVQPFDEILDFHDYAPGEIIDVFDDRPVVRTVDGSLLITRYESDIPLTRGMILT